MSVRRDRSASARGPVDPRLVSRASAVRPFLIAGVAVGSATAVLVLVQAWLLSHSVAGIFATSDLSGLGWTVAALAAVLIGRGLLGWLSTWIAHRTAVRVKSQLRVDIMEARLASPVGSSTSTPALITLVTQGLDALDGYFSKYLPQLVLAVTVPLILGVAILVNDLTSALILAATIPFIPLLMALVGWTTEKQVKRRWRYQQRLASHFADLVAGLPTLQVFGRAKAQAAGLRRTEEANRTETMRTLRVSFLSALVLEMFSTLAVAVVALVIGSRLVYGQLDFTTALFVLILAPEVYLPIRQVGVHYHDSADGVAAAESAFAEIDRTAPVLPTSPVDPRAAGTLVFARQVTYTYPGAAVAALAPTDLTVAPGEVVALAGRSGTGKTTLIGVLLGFLPAGGGSIAVDGRDLGEVGATAWRRQVAYVPQVPGLLPGTVAGNVRLGFPAASDADVADVLRRAGAADLPLDQQVGDDGEGLSAGERRRVGIARALLRIERAGARLLVLDEPTAGLDSDAEAVVLASVRASGAAALVVSHRPAVLAAASRVVELRVPPVADDASVAGIPEPVAPQLAAWVSDTSTAEPGTLPAVPATGSPSAVAVAPSVAAPARSDPWSAPSDSGSVPSDPGSAPSDPGSVQPDPDLGADAALDSLPALVRALLRSVPDGGRRLAAAIALAAGASAAAICLMGVSAWLISKAAQHPPFLDLSVAAVGVRFFGISRGVLRYLERLVGHDLALRMQSALRLETYRRLARTTLVGRRRGDLLVRVVADVEAIQDVVVRVVVPFASAVVVVAGTAAMLARFSVANAVALFATAVVGGVLIPWWAQRASQAADASCVPLRGELADTVHTLAHTATDLVAYDAAGAAVVRLRQVDDRLRRAEARAAAVRGAGTGLQVVVAGSAVIAGLVIGGHAVAAGTMTPRLLAVFVLVPLAMHEVLSGLTQAAQTHTRATVALGRVSAILSAPPVGRGDVPPAPDGDGSVDLDDVTIGWPGHEAILAGITASVRPGEKVAVIGPSGIGKTTLAVTVMGLIPPVAGTVHTTGRIGYLAQDAHIFATTLAENVRIGNKDATDAQVAAALRRAGLDLDPAREVGEMGATLSGGEVRRLALARLYVGSPRLLILDEPTEHLDVETATTLMDDIWAGVDRRPVLVITHDPAVIAACDRVVDLSADVLAVTRA